MADNSGLIVSALQKTDAGLAQSIDAENSWKASLIKSGARVSLFRQYERGDHRANITDQMRAMLRLTVDETGLNDFNDNQCEIIIDEEASRLYVSSVTTDSEEGDAWVSETLDTEKWGSIQGELWRGAIRDASSYVMVDTSLVWTSEPAYNGYSGLVVLYSGKTRLPIWACKLWSEAVIDPEVDEPETQMKIIVYQNEKISYFIGDVNGDEVALDATRKKNEEIWQLGRMPFVAIVNKRDNYISGGKSELRVVIPLQDVLNRSLHSLVMAEELAAYGVRYSIGMEIDLESIIPGGVIGLVLRDADGAEIKNITAEHIEYLKAISVGQFEATDLTQYIGVLDKIVEHIARNSQTPIRGVSSTGNISGDALKQLEIGLLGKIQRFQRDNTDAVRELIRITADMQNIFDTERGNAPQIDSINIEWKDAEILNVNDRMDALGRTKKDNPLLFSDEFYRQKYGVLLGVSDDEIQKENDLAKERQGLMFDTLTGAAGNAPPQSGVDVLPTAAEQSPENLASDKGLNGAQINAALDLLASMSAGTIAEPVAIDLLVSLGIDKTRAESMVSNQSKIKIAKENAPITA